MEEELLPEDVPSAKYKGYSYRADKKIGEGGQAFGVFMSRMIRVSDEKPSAMVVLKCISNTYFMKAGEAERKRRINSFEKEIECLK